MITTLRWSPKDLHPMVQHKVDQWQMWTEILELDAQMFTSHTHEWLINFKRQ